jgi:Domain of unknown function (DUF4397)
MDESMSRRFRLLVVVLAAPLALSSCKINTINSFPTTYANIRFVNVLAETAALDVSEGGALVWSNVTFQEGAGSREFEPSDTSFVVNIAGTTTQLVSGGYALFGNQPYTLVAYGFAAAPALLMIPDDTVEPSSGNISLRIVNAAAGIGFIDAYLTKPGDSLDNLSPSFSGVGYGSATIPFRFGSGQWRLRITPYATKTVIYDSGTRTYADQRMIDAIVYNKGSGTLVNVLMADVNGGAAVATADSTLANVKAIHAAPQTGAVNFVVDTATLVSGEIYPSASVYAAALPGARTLGFEDAAAPGKLLASVGRTLGAATDSTVVLTGFAGSLQAIPLTDNNLPSSAGRPRLRFANMSPDAAPLDVLVGTTKQASALASGTTSGYVEVDAGTYTLTFNDAATGTPVLTIPDVLLSSLQTSTVYAVGPAANLAPLLVLDH